MLNLQDRVKDKEAAVSFDSACLAAANINPKTYLATDYLNHYNEIIMLMEMVPEMPDMVGDILEWEPASYAEHFSRSVFSARDMAIAAYEAARPEVIQSFEYLKDSIDARILDAQAMLAGLSPDGHLDPAFREELNALITVDVRPAIDRMSALIHGSEHVNADDATRASHQAQTEVDSLFA